MFDDGDTCLSCVPQEIRRSLQQAWALYQRADPDAEPYKSKYEAADLLASALTEFTPSSLPEHAFANKLVAAMLSTLRGVVLLDTDLLSQGEDAVSQHIGVLETCGTGNGWCICALLLRAYNALGCLYFNRTLPEEALGQFCKSEQLFQKLQLAHCSPASFNHMNSIHTQTLYYMAQSYVAKRDLDKAAQYCALTLSKQAAAGGPGTEEWVANCMQLSRYFSDHADFATAEYCLVAAEAMSRRMQEGMPDELQANLHVKWGSMLLQQLATSHRQHVDGHEPASTPPVPVQIEFNALDLPPLSDFTSTGSKLAASFNEARDIFNRALPQFKAALEYFQLDGWVTEYVDIKMDVCNLYRCLAGFEADSHRRCAMHKQRIKQLEPLCGQLNEDVYQGLVRSINLELGAAYRDMMEIKEQERGQPDKVAKLGDMATHYYHQFVKSYEEGGKLPAKVPDGHERVFLSACFSLGRIMHRMRPSAGVKALEAAKQSARYLTWAADYVKRHDQLYDMHEEAQLADELAQLVHSKLRLLQHSMGAVGRQSSDTLAC